MVGSAGPVEADFFVGTNGFGHVGVAVVVEGFFEDGDGTLYVAEMGEVDLIGKSANACCDVGAHRCEVSLAVGDPVEVTGDEIDDTLERVDIGDDA